METETKPNAGQEWQIGIGGMTCASCVARVERALKKGATTMPGPKSRGSGGTGRRTRFRF